MILTRTLTQVVYVSRRADGLTERTIDEILSTSAERNRARGVTGVLLMCGRHFMQLLEGDEAVVDPLFQRIAADPRHRDVHKLLRKRVGKRLCPDWGMKAFNPAEEAVLDRARLARMIDDIQARQNTRDWPVEAKVLLNDFRQQLN